jgi:hypothetical protein
VGKNCGEVVESRGFEVFLLPLPAERGAKYIKQCYTDEVVGQTSEIFRRTRLSKLIRGFTLGLTRISGSALALPTSTNTK